MPQFLEQKLRSSQIIHIINSSTYGAKMPRANWSFIGDLLVAYPRTEEEQEKIVWAIRERTSEIDEALKRTRAEIDLIREYRTRLIADVVTGKLDVRGVAVPERDEADTNLDVMEDEGIVADEEAITMEDET